MCLSHLIYTVRPCLIHTCHAMPMTCSDHAVILKATAKHVLCCGLEKNGMVGAWHRHGMASVNQTRPFCVNQMGKTHSKALAARHGRGTAWARYGNSLLCLNRLSGPLMGQLCYCSIPFVRTECFFCSSQHQDMNSIQYCAVAGMTFMSTSSEP